MIVLTFSRVNPHRVFKTKTGKYQGCLVYTPDIYPCSSIGRALRYERRGCRFDPCHGYHFNYLYSSTGRALGFEPRGCGFKSYWGYQFKLGAHVPRLARLLCKQTVKGSIPFVSTIFSEDIMNRKQRKWKDFHEYSTMLYRMYLIDEYGLNGCGDIQCNENLIKLFHQFESHGSSRMSEEEISKIHPFIRGKMSYELNIKMFHQELSEWVRSGNGWYYPSMEFMHSIFKERRYYRSYVKAILKILKNVRDTSIYDVLINFTGFDDSEKEKIFQYYMNK